MLGVVTGFHGQGKLLREVPLQLRLGLVLLPTPGPYPVRVIGFPTGFPGSSSRAEERIGEEVSAVAGASIQQAEGIATSGFGSGWPTGWRGLIVVVVTLPPEGVWMIRQNGWRSRRARARQPVPVGLPKCEGVRRTSSRKANVPEVGRFDIAKRTVVGRPSSLQAGIEAVR